MSKIIKTILVILLVLVVIAAGAVLIINLVVRNSTSERIISAEQTVELEDVDCILVLGCKVNANGVPCDMLEDRLKTAIDIYGKGASPKIIVSGDHGTEEYDEVAAMKQYITDTGIDPSDVFMDHAGFSTYESVYRARDIFGAKKIIIITQEYHLYRSLYIADKLGVEAYGISADLRPYNGQTMREIREIAARVKDFGKVILKPLPTYLGDPIPLTGDGNVTND